ncbi:branched-chain amino acid ABC transporter permease [Elioraea thermophila]|uniref:branched-chain amino acid ABC transporter permease n=1 Tax=Elioraea thermophila TaxID=2185104 RepID=UPI000DF1FED2|nr:branched-chain amino acid ABC transporter permease [Elioraea thermophila]
MFDRFDIFFVQQLINGFSVGLVYALVAIGFTLIFGVLNVVNFAHGEIYMIGAYAGLLAIVFLAPPWVALILLVLAAGIAAGVALERAAFKPFRRFRDEASLKSKAMRESTLLSSLAISIVVRESVEKIFGADMQAIPRAYADAMQDPIVLGELAVASGQIAILAAALVMFATLQWILKRTDIGLSIRAVAANPLGAQYVGVNVDRTVIATFAIGSGMGAVAGILIGLYQGTIFPAMGFAPGVKAFVAMVMGGLNSIPGAVICAIVLGLAEAVATEFFGQGWADLVAYVFLVLTLVFFPTGLFGAGRERV